MTIKRYAMIWYFAFMVCIVLWGAVRDFIQKIQKKKGRESIARRASEGQKQCDIILRWASHHLSRTFL
jgi:hypothetical protein